MNVNVRLDIDVDDERVGVGSCIVSYEEPTQEDIEEAMRDAIEGVLCLYGDIVRDGYETYVRYEHE